MCAPCICSNCHLDACFLAYINDFIIIIAIRICKPDIIYPKLILQSLIGIYDFTFFFRSGLEIVQLWMRKRMVGNRNSVAVCHFAQLYNCPDTHHQK